MSKDKFNILNVLGYVIVIGVVTFGIVYILKNYKVPVAETPVVVQNDEVQNELKIETSIYGNVQGSLDQWINSFAIENTVLKTESILINGKNAKKVLYAGDGKIETRENDSPILIIFYLDGNRATTFTSWPSDTKYSQEFDTIVKTFKFIN